MELGEHHALLLHPQTQHGKNNHSFTYPGQELCTLICAALCDILCYAITQSSEADPTRDLLKLQGIYRLAKQIHSDKIRKAGKANTSLLWVPRAISAGGNGAVLKSLLMAVMRAGRTQNRAASATEQRQALKFRSNSLTLIHSRVCVCVAVNRV